MTEVWNSMQVRRQGSNRTGSLGGFFTFGGSDIYGISNNHVLANFNNCSVGDPICKTGSSTIIGTLQYWVKLNSVKNFLDIALFKLTPDITPYWDIEGNVAYPGGIRKGFHGEEIYMMRNNGNVRKGMITQVTVSEAITFTFSGNQYPFKSLTEIQPLDGQPFSIEGESGSLIFSENHDVLGVLMGTLVDGSKSYYVPFVNGKVGINTIYNLQVWHP